MTTTGSTLPFFSTENSTTQTCQQQQQEHQEASVGLLIFKAICVILITVTNIVINSVCLLVLHKVRDLKPVTRVLLFSMTLSDLGIGVFICAPMIVVIILDSWPYGNAFCQAETIFNYVFAHTSTISLLLVTVERYIAVRVPFDHHKIFTKSRTYAVVVSVWIFSISKSIMAAFLPGRHSHYFPKWHVCVLGPICANEQNLISTILLCITLLPFTITLFLYLQLFFIARYHAKRIAELTRVNRRENIARRKSFVTFIIMTTALLICFTPWGIVVVLENAREKPPPLIFSCIAQLCCLLNTVVNVWIFYIRNTTFREAVLRMLRRWMSPARSRSGSRTRPTSEIQMTNFA